jgi:non-specific serine/threonine protein kinase/serine/threonine-protein kinase
MSPLANGTNGPESPESIESSGAEFRPDDPQLERVGSYTALEVLGEGGMGVVYMAEQTEPVRRRVALKVIKPGMDTKQVVARFEAERQALAVMDHPNIARVFDGGATEAGRPYFVMELVQGVRITEYCDMHKLSVRERLKLFIAVCQAIQHAHQKGVIHRDLKPSNILVADQDGKPVPKVIDFGIAKAMGHRLTEKTLHTQRGQMIGTPAYMSPEQAEMTGLDVDTRTDIYSLGVSLYELVAGDLPFDPKDLEGHQAIVTLRETEPPTPSARFRTLGDRRDRIAESRRSDPTSLLRKLKGDLDWITMKAMEKDRKRRYETANGLALDIQRHLRNEPVLAGAPSARYRVSKFVRRHTAGVAFASVLLAVLLGFAITMSVQAARIARERDRANQEAETAQQVSDFLVGLFEVSDPGEARGNSITAREMLDSGAAKIANDLADQPLVQARLMTTMGSVYRSLGLYGQASPLLHQAVTLRENEHGEDHADVATSLHDLATLYWEQGKYAEAEPLFQRAAAIREKVLGSDDPDLGESLNGLAGVFWSQGRYAEAEPLFQRALAIAEETLGPEHQDVAASLSNLGMVYYEQGKYAEAEPLFIRAVTIHEKVLGPDHPDMAASLNNLALFYWNQGEYAEAEPLLERAVSIAEKTLGPEHPLTATALNTLAALYYNQEKYVEAEPLYLRVIAIREKALGLEHPDLATTLNNLAFLYRKQERYAEAETSFQRALAIWEGALGPDHPDVAIASNSLGGLYLEQGKYAEAEPLIRRALMIWEGAFGSEHPNVAIALNNLANLYRDRGRLAEAEPHYQRALAIREAVLGIDHLDVATTLEDYANLLVGLGRQADADSMKARAERIRDERNQ